MKKLDLDKQPFAANKIKMIEIAFNELLEELAKKGIIELEKEE